jgi:hypothetical protein
MPTRKGVTYDSTGKIISCIFCNIRDGIEPGTIVARNEKFFAFKTTGPMTHTHLLVSPIQHVQNFAALSGPLDAALVGEMLEVNEQSYIIMLRLLCHISSVWQESFGQVCRRCSILLSRSSFK